MFAKYIYPLFLYLRRSARAALAFLRALEWHEVRDLMLFAHRRLKEESLQQVAASLTFTTVLALVPVLTIALAIFTRFPMFDTFRTSLQAYFIQSVMPKEIANTILNYLTMFASKATRLSVAGAVALIFTSVATMNVIERVFNRIWRVRQERRWIKRILVYWAIITLGPVLVGLSVTLSSHVFMAAGFMLTERPMIAALTYTVVSVAVTTCGFTFLYTVVPNRDVEWRDAAWGGMVAGLAFEVAKRVFAIFITTSPTYSRIYGALAALPLFLLWVYVSWMITLVGALLVAALPVVKYERWWHEAVPGGEFVDAMAILRVLHVACACGDTALVSSGKIRAYTRLGFDEMDSLLEKMTTEGWVGRVNVEAPLRVQWGKRVSDGNDHWVLLANVEKLTLAEVYRKFVFGGMTLNSGMVADGDNERDLCAARDAAALAREVETAVEQGLGRTLAEHFGPIDCR